MPSEPSHKGVDKATPIEIDAISTYQQHDLVFKRTVYSKLRSKRSKVVRPVPVPNYTLSRWLSSLRLGTYL